MSSRKLVVSTRLARFDPSGLKFQAGGEIRRRLDKDRQFLAFFERETEQLPDLYVDLMRKDLGLLWDWLPEGALHHDPNAYAKWERSRQASGILP